MLFVTQELVDFSYKCEYTEEMTNIIIKRVGTFDIEPAITGKRVRTQALLYTVSKKKNFAL